MTHIIARRFFVVAPSLPVEKVRLIEWKLLGGRGVTKITGNNFVTFGLARRIDLSGQRRNDKRRPRTLSALPAKMTKPKKKALCTYVPGTIFVFYCSGLRELAGTLNRLEKKKEKKKKKKKIQSQKIFPLS